MVNNIAKRSLGLKEQSLCISVDQIWFQRYVHMEAFLEKMCVWWDANSCTIGKRKLVSVNRMPDKKF